MPRFLEPLEYWNQPGMRFLVARSPQPDGQASSIAGQDAAIEKVLATGYWVEVTFAQWSAVQHRNAEIVERKAFKAD